MEDLLLLHAEHYFQIHQSLNVWAAPRKSAGLLLSLQLKHTEVLCWPGARRLHPVGPGEEMLSHIPTSRGGMDGSPPLSPQRGPGCPSRWSSAFLRCPCLSVLQKFGKCLPGGTIGPHGASPKIHGQAWAGSTHLSWAGECRPTQKLSVHCSSSSLSHMLTVYCSHIFPSLTLNISIFCLPLKSWLIRRLHVPCETGLLCRICN